ncbi:MAG: RDD family protein [Actinomycetota bacterium]
MSTPPPSPWGGGQPADLGMRFVARLVDFVLLGVVQGILFAGGTFLSAAVGFWPFGDAGAFRAMTGVLGSLVPALIALGYFTLMESARGQTVGKMLVRIQARGPDGATPTFEQALKRNLWTALGVIGVLPFVGGVLVALAQLAAVISIAVTISNSPARRGWHDDFAGTSVTRLA